ncbi:hypothetical protein D9756_008232 [Leucocoprinus leucothites]|uniref:ABC transmembrane type-1 domain-containing protein n=1 Tax=Leucocoprinus leucothites TaxID=201217 RepID=A0A8H5FV69_9AGAR|nr:hypothetical protein D9756_008232 [Leucoagaricus leucothites]
MTVFSKPLPYPFNTKQSPSRRTILLILGTVLLLRSLPVQVLHKVFAKVSSGSRKRNRDKGKGRALPDDDIKSLQEQIYEEDEQGRTWLLVPYEGGVQKYNWEELLAALGAPPNRFMRIFVLLPPPSSHSSDKQAFPLLSQSTQTKPNLDLAFLRQLKSILLRILFPPATLWKNKEMGIVLMHSGFLILRTVLSIMVARLDGRIVRDLVKADGKGFLRGLALWFLLAIPSTYTNSMVRTFQFALLRLPAIHVSRGTSIPPRSPLGPAEISTEWLMAFRLGMSNGNSLSIIAKWQAAASSAFH